MHNITKRLSIWAGVVALILMIPLVAMQFSGEWNWGVFDFIFMGALLFGAALTYELVARKVTIMAYRAAVGIAVITSLLLIWINAAVGMIGEGPVNGLYFVIILTGLIGAFIVRFEPRGMSRVLFMMAVFQVLVPALVLMVMGSGIDWEPGIALVFGLSSAFGVLFVLSALLFRRAARGV